MPGTIAIGEQNFGTIRENHYFYVDKTDFIREWWESGDSVTLISRPRRFGKTLTISALEHFFSVKYAGQGRLFEGLSIWQEQKYRAMQGTYPVISLSFAHIKRSDYASTKQEIYRMIVDLYTKNFYLKTSGILPKEDIAFFDSVSMDMPETVATASINKLSDFLYQYYGKKAIILFDEYDTPMQEAYVSGYWNALAAFTRSFFNKTFKTNPFLERGVMTGITRVSRESVFSDLNNLKVVTVTSDKYAAAFGFTEKEVFAAMDEFGFTEKQRVKQWYNGFVFGGQRDIYNPWSILNYLDSGRFDTYWANTSSNSLVGKLIREGSRDIKQRVEQLLYYKPIRVRLDEQVVFQQLDDNEEAIWGLLLASGYVKAISFDCAGEYEIALTNYEVAQMFHKLIHGWFNRASSDYNDFVKALLCGDLDAMNEYMNRISFAIFSSFDVGGGKSGTAVPENAEARRTEPERFYHGFVLGLLVELYDTHIITSNRESGFGRYDIMLEPKDRSKTAIIIEFKIFNKRRDKTLQDTVRAALRQIEEKGYAQALTARGFPEERIRKYGVAFQGKEVLIETDICLSGEKERWQP